LRIDGERIAALSLIWPDAGARCPAGEAYLDPRRALAAWPPLAGRCDPPGVNSHSGAQADIVADCGLARALPDLR
jgi:hypothetical protein